MSETFLARLHSGELLRRAAPPGAQGRPPQQEQRRGLAAEGHGGFDHQGHTLGTALEVDVEKTGGSDVEILKVELQKVGKKNGDFTWQHSKKDMI